jgi:hypothetical protein
MLNVAFGPAPLGARLNSVITFNGPGSWKRDAFWDEYVVTLHNPGAQPIAVTAVGLTDFGRTLQAAEDDPWALEKESKTLERKYKDNGIAFVRYTAPGVLIVGTGAAVISSAGIFSAGAATVIALPVYYVAILTINHHNKVAMQREFSRRRIALPLTLAPGETRVGSLFFPMIPSPRALAVHWSDDSGRGDATLALDFLHGLHLKTSTANAATR